ncbi:hypothetical protein LXL04_028794 [Taraxacum kok-saghyz]
MREKKTRADLLLHSDNVAGKACTFFFTNFPDNCSHGDLWRSFKQHGRIADVFIPKKRSEGGRRFGFARFLNVEDIDKMMVKLNTTWLGSFKLRVNPAKYSRNEQKPKESSTGRRLRSVVVKPLSEDIRPYCSPTHRRAELSYKEVICKNKSDEPFKKEVEEDPYPIVNIFTPEESREHLKRFLVGEAKCFDSMHNIHSLVEAEGLSNLEISYLGGMSIMFEFKEVESATEFLAKAKPVWSCSFSKLEWWSPEFTVNQWLASINILGIPPSGWKSEVFSEVARIWGQVMVPDPCLQGKKNKHCGKVVLLTPHKSWISGEVSVSIDGVISSIKEGRSEVWGSMSEEESAEGEVRSENSWPFNEDRSPACFSPEKDTVPISMGNANNQHENSNIPTECSPVIEVEATHADEFEGHEAQSETQSIAKVDVGLGPATAGPLLPVEAHYTQFLNSLTSVGRVAESTEQSDPEEGVEFMEETIGAWNQEERKEDKRLRALKMRRLKSPCGCPKKLKRNGTRCKHAPLSGDINAPAFVVEREEGAKSTSASLISSSNRRIRDNRGPSESTYLQVQSISEEERRTIEVGTLLGFDMAGQAEQIRRVIQEQGAYVSMVEKDRGFLALVGVWKPLKTACGIINVYAPQDLRSKSELWEKISNLLSTDTDMLWIVCGDFNEVRNADERKGSVFDPISANRLNDFINSTGLIDLNLGGRRYTWMNKTCSKFSKLDRFLVSTKFCETWPNAYSLALPRIHADHCPILLETNAPDFGPSPFPFFSSWLGDGGIEECNVPNFG